MTLTELLARTATEGCLVTHTDTIAGLCAALDAGDDAVLPILADALEEAGEDGLAAGLRPRKAYGILWAIRDFIPAAGHHPRGEPEWLILDPRSVYSTDLGRACVGVGTYLRLSRLTPRRGRNRTRTHLAVLPDGTLETVRGIAYPTRSAAYLALAAALTEADR